MMPLQGSELPICLHVSLTLGWFSFLSYELIDMNRFKYFNKYHLLKMTNVYDMKILIINTHSVNLSYCPFKLIGALALKNLNWRQKVWFVLGTVMILGMLSLVC